MSILEAFKSLSRALRGEPSGPESPYRAYVEPTYLEPWVKDGATLFISGPGCHHLADEGRSSETPRICIDCDDYLDECEGYADCAICGEDFTDPDGRSHLPDTGSGLDRRLPFRWRWVASNTVQCICEVCAATPVGR